MRGLNTTIFSLTLCVTSVLCQNLTSFADGIHDVDPLDKRGWTSIGVGLMVERSHTATEGQSLLKRALAAATNGQLAARDLPGQTPVQLSLDERGNVVFPADMTSLAMGRRDHHMSRRSHLSERGPRKNKSKKRNGRTRSAAARKRGKGSKSRKSGDTLAALSAGVSRTFSSVITWYTGRDLLNPSCADKSGWTPTDESLIAAVTLIWDNKPACGSFIRLRIRGGNKAVLVRLVDSCAGCAPQSAHVDLTKAAFQKLYNLDVGLANNIEAQVLKDYPFSKDEWTNSITKLYGPLDL